MTSLVAEDTDRLLSVLSVLLSCDSARYSAGLIRLVIVCACVTKIAELPLVNEIADREFSLRR